MDHPEIGILIESRLSGPAAGQLYVNAVASEKIGSLIREYCHEKGIPHNSTYVLKTPNDTVVDNDHTIQSSNIGDGDVLYLTNRSAGDEMFGFNNWCVMAIISLIIGLVGLIAISVIFSTTGNIPKDYGIVFDAGSTHTAMMVYKWNGEKMNNTGEPVQVLDCTMKGFGIASFANHLDDLEDALQECLDKGKSKIAGGRVSKTPLYLGATGGMRVLNISYPDTVSNIMNAIDDAFSKSGFQYQSGMVSIISGTVEGADAWITSNYLMNSLTGASNSSFVGTLDLGGASTQFAVRVPELQNETVSLTLYGNSYEIYTHSYLCFGRVQSWGRHAAQLTVGWDLKSNVVDPCLPRGFSRIIPFKDIFASPCTAMNPALIPSSPSDANVTFIGSSSAENCSQLVRSLFNYSECSGYYKYQYCFEPQDLAIFQTPFLAISGFYETVQFLNLSKPTLEEFNSTVMDVCAKPWTTIGNIPAHVPAYSSGFHTVPPEALCFEGQQAFQMLTTGYNFTSSWHLLTFINSVNGMELGWTLGFMINVTNDFAAEVPSQPFVLPVFVILVLLFVIFMILSVTFAAHAWMKSHYAPKYQRLSQYGAI